MKTIITAVFMTGFVTAPFTFAAGTADDLNQVLDASTEYGITHFIDIEHEDGRAEVKGWVSDEWLVELNMDQGYAITKEERRKRVDGSWGMTPADVRQYIDATVAEGMTEIEEIKMDTSGYIEVEGHDANRVDLEIDFRAGSTLPVSVERDR